MTIAIYTGSGVRLYSRGCPLTAERLLAFAHRSVVRVELGAEVARVWLLSSAASITCLRPAILYDTLDYLIGGVAVMLLSNEAEPVRVVQRELLYAAGYIDAPTVRRAAAAKVERDIGA